MKHQSVIHQSGVQYSVSHQILLLYQSQSYNWLRVFYFCVLYQFIGIDNIGLRSFSVEWIFKGRQGTRRRPLVEVECSDYQRRSGHDDQHNYQAGVDTTVRILTFGRFCTEVDVDQSKQFKTQFTQNVRLFFLLLSMLHCMLNVFKCSF